MYRFTTLLPFIISLRQCLHVATIPGDPGTLPCTPGTGIAHTGLDDTQVAIPISGIDIQQPQTIAGLWNQLIQQQCLY